MINGKRMKGLLTEESEYVRNLKEHFGSMPIDQLEAFGETYVEDEYTPEAQKVIQEEFSKRNIRPKTEVLPEKKKTPGKTEVRVSHRGIVDRTYSFELEGVEIIVEHTNEGYIQVYHGESQIYESDGPQTEPVYLNYLDHVIYIQYLKPTPLVMLTKWNFGFRIMLDGKPLEGTVDDPNKRIKIASFGVFFFALIFGLGIVISDDAYAQTELSIFAIVFIALGLLVKKAPKASLITGLIIGLFEFICHVLFRLGNQYSAAALIGWGLGVITRAGAIIAIIQGIRAAFRFRGK